MKKEFEIPSKTEVLSATLFESAKQDTVVIIASATGVKQEYYQKFATFLVEKDITVITFDYSGIGRSLKKPIQKVANNASDWGTNDLEAVIQFVVEKYPGSRKVIVGHSIGGQLIGLAKSSMVVDKLILVASQSGYWKYWRGVGKVKMWFNWYILFPLLLNAFGYLNSKKVSGMENLPHNVANQWRNWGKHPNYILSDPTIIEKFYDKIEAPVTSYSIDDDDFAPLEAVQWMTLQYQNSQKKSVHLKPVDFGVKKIGHFGIFKEKFKNKIWSSFLREILN